MRNFIKPNGNCSNSDVLEFENLIGYSLPISYRDFLINTNGGDTVPNTVKFGRDDSTSIRAFYGLNSVNSSGNLISRIGFYGDETRVPKNAIAIAFDDGGWSFMLYLAGDKFCQVWLMDSERRMHFVSKDFQGFIHSIEVSNEEGTSPAGKFEMPAPITKAEWLRRQASK